MLTETLDDRIDPPPSKEEFILTNVNFIRKVKQDFAQRCLIHTFIGTSIVDEAKIGTFEKPI